MKLLYFSGLVFVLLSICSLQLVVSQDDGDAPKDTEPAVDDNTNTGTDVNAGDTPKGDGESDPTQKADTTTPKADAATEKPEQGTPKPVDTTAETEKEGDDDSNTNENTDNDDETAKKDDALKSLGVNDDCQATITKCFKDSSKSLDTVKCDDLKDKNCYTNTTMGGKCSGTDFDKLKDSVCFCPRSAPSLLLVGILCILAKLLVNH